MNFRSPHGRGTLRRLPFRLARLLALIGTLAAACPMPAVAGNTEDKPVRAKATSPAKATNGVKPGQPRAGVVKLEKKIAALRDQLAISGAQRKPWRDFAAVLRANEAQMYAVVARRAGRIRTGNAPENLRLYGLVAAVHAANIQRLLGAFEPLYDALSDRQKKIADTILRDAREGQISDGY